MKLIYIIAAVLFVSSCNGHKFLRLRSPMHTKYKDVVKYKDTVAFVKPLLALYEQVEKKTFLPVHNKSEQLTQVILVPVYRTLLHQKLNLVNYTLDSLIRKLLVRDLEVYTNRITHYHKVKNFRLNDTLVTLLKNGIQQKYIIVPFIKWSTWTEAYFNKKQKIKSLGLRPSRYTSSFFATFYSEWFLCIEVKTGEIIYYRGRYDEIEGRGEEPQYYFKFEDNASHHINIISKHFLKKIKRKQ